MISEETTTQEQTTKIEMKSTQGEPTKIPPIESISTEITVPVEIMIPEETTTQEQTTKIEMKSTQGKPTTISPIESISTEITVPVEIMIPEETTTRKQTTKIEMESTAIQEEPTTVTPIETEVIVPEEVIITEQTSSQEYTTRIKTESTAIMGKPTTETFTDLSVPEEIRLSEGTISQEQTESEVESTAIHTEHTTGITVEVTSSEMYVPVEMEILRKITTSQSQTTEEKGYSNVDLKVTTEARMEDTTEKRFPTTGTQTRLTTEKSPITESETTTETHSTNIYSETTEYTKSVTILPKHGKSTTIISSTADIQTVSFQQGTIGSLEESFSKDINPVSTKPESSDSKIKKRTTHFENTYTDETSTQPVTEISLLYDKNTSSMTTVPEINQESTEIKKTDVKFWGTPENIVLVSPGEKRQVTSKITQNKTDSSDLQSVTSSLTVFTKNVDHEQNKQNFFKEEQSSLVTSELTPTTEIVPVSVNSATKSVDEEATRYSKINVDETGPEVDSSADDIKTISSVTTQLSIEEISVTGISEKQYVETGSSVTRGMVVTETIEVTSGTETMFVSKSTDPTKEDENDKANVTGTDKMYSGTIHLSTSDNIVTGIRENTSHDTSTSRVATVSGENKKLETEKTGTYRKWTPSFDHSKKVTSSPNLSESTRAELEETVYGGSGSGISTDDEDYGEDGDYGSGSGISTDDEDYGEDGDSRSAATSMFFTKQQEKLTDKANVSGTHTIYSRTTQSSTSGNIITGVEENTSHDTSTSRVATVRDVPNEKQSEKATVITTLPLVTGENRESQIDVKGKYGKWTPSYDHSKKVTSFQILSKSTSSKVEKTVSEGSGSGISTDDEDYGVGGDFGSGYDIDVEEVAGSRVDNKTSSSSSVEDFHESQEGEDSKESLNHDERSKTEKNHYRDDKEIKVDEKEKSKTLQPLPDHSDKSVRQSSLLKSLKESKIGVMKTSSK
ncbi:hypothetical protein JTB14_027525 [Gonioctena quinquepunctata]|nr:hypothetical protein JTB14_027525 [Gonioctena quinquepunctata]